MTTARLTPKQRQELHTAQVRHLNAEAERHELESQTRRFNIRDAEAENSHHGIYHFVGEVDIVTTWNAMRAMEKFVRIHPGKGVELLITSPGGSVIHGLGLFDHLAQFRRIAGVQLTTVGIGIAGSMAGVILQAGEKRVMTQESWLLIHESQFAVEGSMGSVKDTVEWVDKIQERIIDIFVSRAKIKRTEFVKNMKRTNWWLSSADALKLGFVDEVR